MNFWAGVRGRYEHLGRSMRKARTFRQGWEAGVGGRPKHLARSGRQARTFRAPSVDHDQFEIPAIWSTFIIYKDIHSN